MKTLQFSTTINAPREKVWEVLWGKDTYPQWTAPFGEGSRAETDWKEGSKVLFLSASGDGMASEIVMSNPPEFMAFRHLAEVKDGMELPVDEKVREWAGAMENYTLRQTGNATTLTVEMDMMESHADFFHEAFPKALEKVKELAEV
jgi:uncharacterized protein YndB with AHSA1/START domain